MTDFERARRRANWRRLSQAGAAGDLAGLKDMAADLLNWSSPVESKGYAFAFFSYSRMVFAFIRASAGEREVLRPALLMLAGLVGDILDATDPAAAPPPPQLPFRADIDG